jgi:poly-gamma-glutamate synthesis protein (capsule biosynthesis protein)
MDITQIISEKKWLIVSSVIAIFFVSVIAVLLISYGVNREAESVFAVSDENGEDETNESQNENENESIDTEILILPTPAPTPPPTARVAFVGDIMCHIEQINAARVSQGEYDFNYAFRYVSPYIQAADFAIANLETTLVRSNFAGWPLFRSPAALAEALVNAGFSMVTTGNNHSFDARESGVHSTIEILNEVGLSFTGTYLTPECREEIFLAEVNGFTFAILNMTMHMNGICLGENNFMVKAIYLDLIEQRTIDYELIRSSMARARALSPDFIVVLPHIGIEYYGTMNRRGDSFNQNDGRWINWVRTLELFVDEGADIVMNHHPHTLLPAEFVYVTNDDGTTRRAFIAYSMANFVSAQRTQPRETSAIFYLDVTRDENGVAFISHASYTPVWVRSNDPTRAPRQDFTVLPVTETLQRAESEPTPDLRPQDLARIRQIHLEVTHMLSGEPIPHEHMQHEYEITRSRAREQFPGLPLWGTLPWW